MVRGWWEIMYKDIVGAAKIVTQPGQSLGMTSMVSHLARCIKTSTNWELGKTRFSSGFKDDQALSRLAPCFLLVSVSLSFMLLYSLPWVGLLSSDPSKACPTLSNSLDQISKASSLDISIAGTLTAQNSPSRPSHGLLARPLIGCSESGAFSGSNQLWPGRRGPMLLKIVAKIMDGFLHCLSHLELQVLLPEQAPH